MQNDGVSIFFKNKEVAKIFVKDEVFSLQYLPEWLENGFSISSFLPLQDAIFSGSIVSNFIRNLLPEGQALDDLSSAFGLSKNNAIALIVAMGRETAGALTFLPYSGDLDQTNFTSIDLIDLENRLSHRQDFSLFIWDGKVRLSVAGVQDKLNVLFHNGVMGFGDGDLCSTHILKFEKHHGTNLVVNEYLCMKLAESCGIAVAHVDWFNIGNHKALLVERFDREVKSELLIEKLHVIDGCQAFNLPPSHKYERNFGNGRDVAHIRDGASFSHIFEFASKTQYPAQAREKVIDWIIFNLIIANYDAHGKNISFHVNQNGFTLAPYYDLVNISMFPNFDQTLAMAIGDNFDPKSISKNDMISLAVDCNLNFNQIRKRALSMIGRVERSIDIFDEKQTQIDRDYWNLFVTSIKENSIRLSIVFMTPEALLSFFEKSLEENSNQYFDLIRLRLDEEIQYLHDQKNHNDLHSALCNASNKIEKVVNHPPPELMPKVGA